MSHVSKLSLRRSVRQTTVAALVATLLGLGLPRLTQPGAAVPAPETAPFQDETRVVAVDTMVSIKRGRGGQWLHGDATPKDVAIDGVEVVTGDTVRRVVAIEPALSKDQEVDEPWTIVLWFDAAFADSTSLRWAATYLGEAAASLTALGSVEVLLAPGTENDEAPGGALGGDAVRQVVPPTRDAQELTDALSRMAVEGTTGSDTLRRLRAEFLTVAEREPELAGELAQHAADLELALVQGRHDLLLTSLLERGLGSPRRAVFLVTDGWDAEPATFYQRELEADLSAGRSPGEPAHPALPAQAGIQASADGESLLIDPPTQIAGRTLAAYGWLVYPLLAPPPPPPPPGFYIGKWFFHKPSLKPQKGTPIPMLPGLIGTRKKYLDPERARAFLALGQALIGQDKIDDAIEAFEKAIFHFQNDKRTQGEQANVWAALGEAFGQAGRSDDKLRAFERVAQLDPERAARLGGVARVLAPEASLAALARTTSGFLVQDDDALRHALDDLRWRMRLTLELAGAPAGDLLPLTITHRGGLHVTAPAWARSATPPEITALRVRRLLGEPLDAAELGASWPLELTVEVDATGTRITVMVDLSDLQPAAADAVQDATLATGATRYFRPTLALRMAESATFLPSAVTHGPVERWSPSSEADTPTIDAAWTDTWQWTFDLEAARADLDDDEEGPLLLAVIVDELESGTWGGDTAILEDDR